MKLGLRVAVAAAAAMAFTLSACSPDSGTSGGSEDAAALVSQSAEAMKSVTGMHLELTTDGKVPNLKVTKVSGDLTNDPATAAEGTASISMGSKEVDAKFVYVDEHLYSDVAETGKFTDYGDGNSIYNVAVILDPDKGLANLLANLKDPKSEGTEQIDGVEATRISGSSSSNDVAILAGARMAPEDEVSMPTTVWVANDGSNHLLKVELTPVPDATVTLTLSDFNKTVNVTKPV